MPETEWTYAIPPMVPMEQSVEEPVVADPQGVACREVLARIENHAAIGPGKRVAITVGSRGIGGIAAVARGVCDAVKQCGAEPFIVPAMGSHGGTDPLEKADILSHLGVSEASVGARIATSANIVLAGESPDGIPVYCNEEALAADAIILLNRIKPHTDFRGEIESGLVKIACVGLGGYLGAQWVHRLGYDHLARRIRSAGEAAIQMLNIPVGLAIIEGHAGVPAVLEAIPGHEIPMRERELLEKARAFVMRLPVGSPDVLVVTQMGKDISGLGLDPLITGRYPSGKTLPDADIPHIQRVAVLDLTDGSAGNASGIGLCDITTRKLYNKINFPAMYKNVITSRGSASARIPMVMESDREAISVACLTSHGKDNESLGIVLIRDTLHLRRFLVSPVLVEQCEKAGARRMGTAAPLVFDSDGELIPPECFCP